MKNVVNPIMYRVLKKNLFKYLHYVQCMVNQMY